MGKTNQIEMRGLSILKNIVRRKDNSGRFIISGYEDDGIWLAGMKISYEELKLNYVWDYDRTEINL